VYSKSIFIKQKEDKMKKLVYLFILIGLIAMNQPNYGQFKDWGTKFGIRYSQLFPENEFANLGFGGNDDFSFDWFKFSYLAEGFLGFELSKSIEMQLTGGYGSYAGKAYSTDKDNGFGEYETTIIPIHLRFRISPFDVKGWNPYFYFGGGVMNYSINTHTSNSNSSNTDGWVAIIPVGIGSEFALSERVLLDFSLGGAMSSIYDLDSYKGVNNDVWDAYLNASLGLTFTGENCKSDRDKDGLGKCDEEKIGTDPKNPDTDGDGLNDGEEYLNYKTNPLVADTDGDGLNDGSEVNNYKTNPLVADTDGDGLNDGQEVNTYKTDPLNADTDGDGLNDGQEVNTYKTDPLNADTDGDGLNDGQEVNKYKTNPLNRDTDAGSIDDGTEVRRGTNPLDPSDDIAKVVEVPLEFQGITFGFDRSDISAEAEGILNQTVPVLEQYTNVYVEIAGHTDNIGTDAYNQKLSERRAEAVKVWLVSKGISADRITTIGYGESKPKVENNTADNRRINRRIEFSAEKK
jgi:outer membrane protein OmpA-like peptidoglycan-associated protein